MDLFGVRLIKAWAISGAESGRAMLAAAFVSVSANGITVKVKLVPRDD
jgi:hypothetical protein